VGWYLFAPKRDAAPNAGWHSVTPTAYVAPGGGGAGLSGSF
jgi:hypothetical protein